MFRDVKKILNRNNRNGRNTTNLPGTYMQYANKHGNNVKNLPQYSFQTHDSFTRKRKWQSEPDRLPLRMIVTPLIWRDNLKKENEINEIPDGSNRCYQRQTINESPFSSCQEKRRKTSGESFSAHSQRILERIRRQQIQNSLNRRNKLHTKKECGETENNSFSSMDNYSSELYSKNSPIQLSEIEDALQSPVQNISVRQMPLNSIYRACNNVSAYLDKSPSVLDESTSSCESVLTDLNSRDNRPPSVESGSNCESFCDRFNQNCIHNSSFNSEDQFNWNPVVVNSPPGDIDKQIDWELDSINKQINQELDCVRQIDPENNRYSNNAQCFSDFNENDPNVLYSDSEGVASSSHGSNSSVKSCFEKCEEFWSGRGHVSLKTTFEFTDITKVSLKDVGEEDFYYFEDSD